MSNQSRFHSHPRAFQFIRQLWQWCLFVVLLMAGYHGQGQTYPVQVTTTLLPPYSPELSYYSSADVNNMQVFVHVLELDRVDYRAKLRLTIEGAGVRLTTLPSYVPNPLVLQGGVPLMLSGFDLRHYLNPDHLAFEGMTKADFMRNGRLPEGFYTFTIEVLDYTRGVRVSNASMATAWIVLNDPPLINFPINADKITLSEPQFVNFSWLGRHLASPNAAFSTEYEFSLYEMLPGQTSPDAAVRSSNTIYRTTTTQSSLLYGPAEPLLEPGKKYAFRVQAYDVSGRDLFKNQGYSETYWFQYGDECMHVKFLAGEALDDSRIKVTWESEMSHTGFTLQYREKGKSSWHTEQALFGAQVIPDLQANTEYEYQVAGKCLNYIGDYSTIQTVKTEERASGPEDEGTYACGEEGEASDLNPTPLEKTLRTLDQFEIGGIDVIILEATKGSDGSYTGTGYSPLPIFKGAGLKVSIENVIINEDYKAIAGKVVTTYDEEGSFIFGSHDEREPEGEDVPNGIEDLPTVVVTIPVEIASVTVADGVVTVLDETGTPVSLESTALPAEGNTLTLEDASGDQWLVDSEGNVQKAEPTAASQAAGTAPAAISADENVDFSITFEAYTDQKFGFDDPKQPFDKTTTGLSAGYTQKQVQEENYWVAWKSVATGQTDWVTATHDAGEALPAYVGFKTTTGELASQPSEQEQSKAITVLGKSNQHTETVTAYVKQEDEEGNETEKTLGVLQVISYDQVRERVIIVPVNDATVPDAYTVGEALNRIYGQAVAHWEVEVSSSYQVEAEILTQLDEGESGILSSFPSNMQGFNRDYKRSLDNYDKDAYYLFLIPGSDSDRAGLSADRAGFMPFKRQFGYIWTDKTSNQSTTIAHELGHGAFRLRHTFSTENFVAGERTTDNLMDYKGGTQLYKHQWDFVHDPESMNGWAQEDEESDYSASLYDEKSPGCDVCMFISPAGVPFAIDDVSKVSVIKEFSRTDEGSGGIFNSADFVTGAVYGYEKDNTQFYAYIDGNKKFHGFLEKDNKDYVDFGELTRQSTQEEEFTYYYYKIDEGSFINCSKPSPTIKTGVYYADGSVPTDKDEYECDRTEKKCQDLWDDISTNSNNPGYQFTQEGNYYYQLAKENPCLLSGVHTYGEGLGYETEFMKGLNTMVGGFAFVFTATVGAVVVLPAVIEGLVTHGVTINAEALTTKIVEKSSEFTTGFVVDGLIQGLIIYFTSPADEDIELWSNLDYYQMTASGVEATYNNRVVAAFQSCAFDALTEDGELVDLEKTQDWNQLGTDCFWGAVSSLGADAAIAGVAGSAKGLKNLIKNNPDRFIRLLTDKLNLGDEVVVSSAKKFGFTESFIRARIFKYKNLDKFEALGDKADDLLVDLTEGLPNLSKAFRAKPELVDAWKRLDDLGTDIVPDALRKNPKLLEALDAPKGSRKAPSTYLDQNYIDNHLAKFDQGSSRIVNKADYNEFGVGKPDVGKTEFVFPKSEMDEILSLPNAEKAKRLGIPESQLDGDLVRIDFEPTNKIDIPSGNEFGANDKWIPGGKTDGGVSEAVVKTEGMQLDVDYIVNDL